MLQLSVGEEALRLFLNMLLYYIIPFLRIIIDGGAADLLRVEILQFLVASSRYDAWIGDASADQEEYAEDEQDDEDDIMHKHVIIHLSRIS